MVRTMKVRQLKFVKLSVALLLLKRPAQGPTSTLPRRSQHSKSCQTLNIVTHYGRCPLTSWTAIDRMFDMLQLVVDLEIERPSLSQRQAKAYRTYRTLTIVQSAKHH